MPSARDGALTFVLPMPQSDLTYDDHKPTGHVAIGYCCHSVTSLETKRGRRNNAVILLFVVLIPVVALFVQNTINVQQKSMAVQRTMEVRDDILFSVETGMVIHYVQIERGVTALYVSSGLDAEVLTTLRGHRNRTNKSMRALTQWPKTTVPKYFSSVDAYLSEIQVFRDHINVSTEVVEVLTFYSEGIEVMIQWVSESVKFSREGTLWQVLVGYHMLMVGKEQAGVERALGGTFFAQGRFSPHEMESYIRRKVLGESYLKRSAEYHPEVETFLKKNFRGTDLDLRLAELKGRILANNESAASVSMGSWWFRNMTQYINMLKAIQDKLAEDIVSELDFQTATLKNSLTTSIIVMLLAMLLTPVVMFCLLRVATKIEKFAVTLTERTHDLDLERKRSQTILFELLPVQVAQKLINRETIEPESYQSATVFFSDIVGFTVISSNSSPLQIVAMLNMLYKKFDDELEVFDVYKVETIGDAYMVVSGLPQRNGERHSAEIANLALNLRIIISGTSVPHIPDHKLQLRIGINTGPVVAGIVGTKMPRYCIFGDTVNVASRMESTSLPLYIQISQSTKDALDKHSGFVTEDRGSVEIKGKGLMNTYWLIGTNTNPRLTCSLSGR
ncbi:soluble guanylate cyclase gcy-35-like [Gigantopelta aegis]|uniref:soluble guanylate cyclase gcy-35-like n=1 Tax=Gigantopelta aegis TaxID=1735272 RepID=UPI001B88C554|nr:soluble guanylate cyclase gcy-35-like [Gigantopelta aegis]